MARWARILAPVAVIAVLAGIIYFDQTRLAANTALPHLDCPDLAKGCATELGGRSISLGLDGLPQAMKPFELWLRAPGARMARAEFAMADMDMGLNQYTLQADNEGVWRARVTLPVCVTGRSDWLMTLDVDGQKLVIPFVIGL